MPPELPADLSALTDEELSELLAQFQAYFAENRDAAASSDEILAALSTCADAVDAINAETDRRASEAADREATLAELAARMAPAAGETDPEGGDPPAEGDQGAEGTGTGTEGETAPAGDGEQGAEGQTPEQIAAAARRQTATRRAASRRPAVPSLAAAAEQTPAEHTRPAAPVRPRATIVAGADIPHVPIGTELPDIDRLAEAMISRREAMRGGKGGDGESIIVASIMANFPDERRLRTGQEATNRKLIEAVTGREAIVAAGGLCAPVQPYYEIMTLAGADRPVRDATPSFGIDRGGITLVPPPQLSAAGTQARTVNDGTTTNGSNVVGSVAAAFSAQDIGATITGAGIPAATTIVAVNPGASQATLSANATATAAGVAFTITQKGPIGFITMAQDAAALGGTPTQIATATKPCLHVTCPAPVTFLLAAITRCLEFGNFTARAYPEQVEAWLTLALAQWARRAETALLDGYAANSTQVTAAKVLGVARDIIPQVVKAAAYYRNRNRMSPDAPLRWMGPAWLIDAAVADIVRGSGYEAEFLTMARQMFVDGLREANINATFYIDSGTGKGQLINGGAAQGAGALTTFPGTAVWYLFAEGSFLFLDGGSLDLGLVRDSGLNSLNNYRIFGETFEQLAFVGLESLEVTSTIVADGSYAGAAYGLQSATALPAAF